jgi:hypothetical protein
MTTIKTMMTMVAMSRTFESAWMPAEVIWNMRVPSYVLAEEVGFEPTEPCGSTVFKTAAFNHSAIPPRRFAIRQRRVQAATEPNAAQDSI